jgi:hypothetical protein
MKNNFVRSLVASAGATAVLSLMPIQVFGQAAPAKSPHAAAKTEGAQIPRMPDGKPDFNGVWVIPYTPDMSKEIGGLPFTALGEQDFKQYDPAKYDSTGHCLPAGLTRMMNTPMPIQISQSPKSVVVLFEAWMTWRVIPTDGRDHPKDPEPTWMGNSVGHWDGDTLVVDSIGFNEKTRLDTIGHPHSDQMHVMERFRMSDATHIAYQVTVEDPKMYTKQWTNNRVFTLRPDWQLMEYSCEENNVDVREGHIK